MITGAAALLKEEKVPTWVELERTDLRLIPDEHRLTAPPLLEAGKDHEHALSILQDALGFEAGSELVTIASPIEQVRVRREHLPHTVEKRLDARERYAHFIRPTLETPYEVWRRQDGNGHKHHYIAAFTGKNDLTVSVRIDEAGNLFWNFMQRDGRRMNGLREGELLHCR